MRRRKGGISPVERELEQQLALATKRLEENLRTEHTGAAIRAQLHMDFKQLQLQLESIRRREDVEAAFEQVKADERARKSASYRLRELLGSLLANMATSITRRRRAGTRTEQPAIYALDLLTMLVPKRISNEEIGDAMGKPLVRDGRSCASRCPSSTDSLTSASARAPGPATAASARTPSTFAGSALSRTWRPFTAASTSSGGLRPEVPPTCSVL